MERGYAGTSIRDIAEHLGMTKGSLYYHFTSKEDLLDAMVQPLLEGMESLARRAAGESMDEEQLLTELVDLFCGAGAALGICLQDPSALHHLAQRHDIRARFLAMEAALAPSGTPHDVLRATCALGAVHAGTLKVADRGRGAVIPGPALTPAQRALVVRAGLAALRTG